MVTVDAAPTYRYNEIMSKDDEESDHKDIEREIRQSNAISRSAYRMPVMARRLIFIFTGAVQSIAPEDDLIATLRVGEVLDLLDLTDGEENYKAIRNAVETLANHSIQIERENGDWTIHQWIYRADYSKKQDTITIHISDDLRDHIVQLRSHFTKLAVKNFGKLQGRHSQRLYEIIMSSSGHAGQNGNWPGTWWVRLTKERLRKLLLIQENEYRTTADLRRSVVENPIKEINRVNIGIHIRVEYERSGRELAAFIFYARFTSENERAVDPASADEEKQERLKALNPEIWEEELANARAQKDLFDERIGALDLQIEMRALQSFLKRSDLIKK